MSKTYNPHLVGKQIEKGVFRVVLPFSRRSHDDLKAKGYSVHVEEHEEGAHYMFNGIDNAPLLVRNDLHEKYQRKGWSNELRVDGKTITTAQDFYMPRHSGRRAPRSRVATSGGHWSSSDGSSDESCSDQEQTSKSVV